LTLGFTSALTEAYNIADTGGVFLVGLGLTFLLVALLAKMKWAFIPAAVLLLLGFFVGTPFEGVLSYIWIGLLLLAGIALVVSAIRSK
jgi:predicted Kef-type K+ transport protein